MRGSIELVLYAALLVAVSLTAVWWLMAWRTGLFRQPALFAGWTLPGPISFFEAFMALVQWLLVGLINR